MSDKPEPQETNTRNAGQIRTTPRLVLMLPLILVCIVLCTSPNFRFMDGDRTAPLGGDFLQEWVGGWIVTRGDQDRLYDLDYVQSVQHDPELVGFVWPEKDYFPMVYPPFYYLLVSPMAGLGYSIAMKIWAIFAGLALSLTGFLIHRYYPPSRRWFAICFVAAMFYVPLLLCLNMGQKSTFLLLILTGAFLLLHHGRPFSAGLVFGLIAFKPHLGIVIGLVMLLKCQWRFAAGAILVVAILVGGSYAWNPELWKDYLKVVSGMDNYVRTGGYQLTDAHSLWGAMQLSFSWLSPSTVKVIVVAISIIVLFLVWQVMRGPLIVDSPFFARQFSALIFATLLLSPHFYTYDLVVLLLPMLLIVSTFTSDRWRTSMVDRNLGWVLLAIFGLAGFYSQVAGVTKIQPSVVLALAAIVLIGMTARQGEESTGLTTE